MPRRFEPLYPSQTTEQERLSAARSRVKAGARWLDECFPGWESRINLKTLELSNSSSCICGQVFQEEARKISGYSYASDNLFSEANSWITALVGIKPGSPNTEQNDDRVWALYERIDRVSKALGFNCGSITNARWQRQAIYVDFDELQTAWVELLQRRANV